MEKLQGKSLDILKENVKKLKKIFPDTFREGKVDFDQLKNVLGDYIDDQQERYSFTWNGKSKAIRLAQTPSTATLRPGKEESKNWDSTQNLYIEGDNLEVLKLLQKTYHNKVKLIYIDPPYNTGNDFVYPDDYKESLRNYLELTRQIDEDGRKTSTNADYSGRYHTNWLNMIYPRLRLARNLLREDGAIFISIDDNEVYNLRKVCNEIFGEENFVANIIWEKNYAPKNNNKYLSENHDYILLYCKNKEKWNRNLLPISEKQRKLYKNLDNDPRGDWKADNFTVSSQNEKNIYKIVTPSGREVYPPAGASWRYSREKYEELIRENRVWFGKDGSNSPAYKRFLNETQQGTPPMTIWKYKEVGHTQDSKKELIKLFDNVAVFDTPKPVELIKRMLIIGTNSDEEDIILDFFSGSAATAHTTMELNAENHGNRKFIMVQLPEPTDEKSEAYRAGYKSICDIGRDRINRAGKKILKNNKDKEGIENLDTGFRVFKLDSSNIKAWNPDYDNLEITLEDMIENFVDGRTEEDILYEIILKYGINLTHSVDKFEVAGTRIFSVGSGALMVCLDDNITVEIAKGIVEIVDKQDEKITRVVFKDNGFTSDSIKTNVLQTLKRHGIEEVVSI